MVSTTGMSSPTPLYPFSFPFRIEQVFTGSPLNRFWPGKGISFGSFEDITIRVSLPCPIEKSVTFEELYRMSGGDIKVVNSYDTFEQVSLTEEDVFNMIGTDLLNTIECA